MTQQEIIEYNKRCADFLGVTLHESQLNIPHSHFTGYHSDWNWIMEVVEAIEKLADWTLECLNYSDGSRDYQMMIPLSNTNIINKDKKEAVVEAINQFLVWYNSQK